MTDKVLCPWCGRKMKIYCEERGLEDYIAWSLCTYGKCAAEGPLIRGAKTEEEAIRLATEAALRRYEPPCKPLTLDEVRKTDDPMWVENKKGTLFIGDFYCSFETMDAWDVEVLGSATKRLFLEAYYGKTWRCWPRKPTEEERREAKWDD